MADHGAVTSDVLSGGAGKRARRWFGTDGVRGVVGEALTAELVERLGRAATLWSGRGRVLVGRDTRGSGPGARGGADARDRRRRRHGRARRASCRRPPSRCSSQDLGLVVSASHNPPEYNGVKVFDREGHKLTDADELEIEALLGRARPGRRLDRGRRGRRRELRRPRRSSTSAPTSAGSGSRSTARTGRSHAIAPGVFERLGAEVTALADDARRVEHQRRLRGDRPRDAAGDRPRGGPRPRGRLRRRRRPDARRGRERPRSSTATRSWRSARSPSGSTSSRSRS